MLLDAGIRLDPHRREDVFAIDLSSFPVSCSPYYCHRSLFLELGKWHVTRCGICHFLSPSIFSNETLMPVEIRTHSTRTEISKELLKQLDLSLMCMFTVFRLYVAYSLAIAFGIFELVPLMLGVTSISIRRSMFGRPFARETVGSDLLFR